MFRRTIFPAIALIVVLMSTRGAEVAYGVQPINFIRGTVAGAGFATAGPTTLTVDPEGRLYVADGSGKIQILTLNANKQVTAVQQVTTNTDLQEVYGIALDPTDVSLPHPIYVSNTVSGFGDADQAPPGSFPGKITKISGTNYTTRTDIISNLPVSNSGHEANGIAFGPDGRLYIDQGSTTNAGIIDADGTLFQRDEVPTSGAVLVADIKAPGFNGNITYNPPSTYGPNVNQTGGDVSVYASGFRNPYDLVFHTNGRLYTTDNGPNDGYGPASTSCSTDTFPVDASALDELNIVVEGNYYGHPNRNRGRTDSRQCVYHPGTEASNGSYTGPIEANLPASSDGLAEYKSNKFGGQMQGDLLYTAWVDSQLHRVKLSPDGSSVVSDTTLATGLSLALDVAVGADGTIFVAEYGGNKITFFKPDETPVSAITVTSISPNAGSVSGGSAVTISGTNFTTTAETSVTIGGLAATNVVVQNSSTITALTPPHTAGAQDVVVTNTSLGSATLSPGFTYVLGGGTVPPVANAGPDVSTPIAHIDHAHVTIDGRSSFDPDGFIVSYQWKEGATVLSSASADSIQLTLGEHIITLTVVDNDNIPSSDSVRVIVTSQAENPQPYFCPDVNGDVKVDSTDQLLLALAYNKRFGQVGYARLRDTNVDRIINSTDQYLVAKGFTRGTPCSLVDQQIRAATVAMEPYQDVNVAIAAGYLQSTPFIPGQGRHMIKGGTGGLGNLDTVFNPSDPESLLYEPDPHTPGGWRLGGAMFVIPIALEPLVPDGFAGSDDPWHYHNGLCIWNNSNAVQELTVQAECLARSGNPVWIEKAGWLLHLWNYLPNPTGRFVEINNNFMGIP